MCPFPVYTIGRCVVLTCSDYFKSTGVLVLQPAVPKKGAKKKKRDRNRKNVLYRQREVFKRKIKKKCLILKRVDIKDSFRHMFSDMNLDGSDRRVNAKGGMRLVDRSKIVGSQPKATMTTTTMTVSTVAGGHSNLNKKTNENNKFSIINVNDIIRDTDTLHKF